MPSGTAFRPTTSGLHFANAWPTGTPALSVDTPFGRLALGDASNGLCGGMVFAAADLWVAGRPPPPGTTPPPAGSAAVNFLTGRLLASWDLPTGVLRYALWMSTPDQDTLWGTRPGVQHMTVQQLPRITGLLDAGQLCPLGVVTVQSSRPNDLKENHQVLAYAYERDGDDLVLLVYDPNRPDSDDVSIRCDTSVPPRHAPVANLGLSHPVRGLFPVAYRPADPAPLFAQDAQPAGQESAASPPG
jgi:hypothetical protein